MICKVYNSEQALEYFMIFSKGCVDCIKGDRVKRVTCYADARIFFDYE